MVGLGLALCSVSPPALPPSPPLLLASYPPLATHDDLFVLEYSEDAWPASKQSSISLTVAGPGAGVLAGGPYTISSTHPRNWITPYGAFVPQAGAWWDAIWTATATAGRPTTTRHCTRPTACSS